MLLILLIILLIVIISNINVQHDINNEIYKEYDNDTIEIKEYIPIGVMNNETEALSEYEHKDIPKIPYRTHKDLIAPPKFVVQSKCPECPDNWE